jgi:CheY-like chemotaxis protein
MTELQRLAGFRRKRVMAVDDAPANLMVLASFLRHATVDVRTIDCGAAALAAYQDFQPHLVFMDLSMPDVDGFAAAAAIRQFEAENAWSRVPIVALTAFALDAPLLQRIDLAMDDCLSKPVRRIDIKRILQKYSVLKSDI